ncbi:hypothetical protein [Tropicimonas sp. IMCC6043]|uniref:hypothetical protein n=1 Tax=Tropicimonas sp. IMCC6043 TaxID=2510645 RepID=UPI00101DB398|nr:hypothetical protein [Tropicimonas sp. IMCC6043]RYH07244.1 hypothetical protein EU800_21005 [Tropicimonas sp. IMCC6043]
MALPLLAPLRDLLAAQAGDAAKRVAMTAATTTLAALAASFLVAAGLAALTAAAGFPVAALLFAVLFAALALAVHLLGLARASRRAEQLEAERTRFTSDVLLATALGRSARPLLPLAAFLAAFALARRL